MVIERKRPLQGRGLMKSIDHVQLYDLKLPQKTGWIRTVLLVSATMGLLVSWWTCGKEPTASEQYTVKSIKGGDASVGY